MILESLNNVAKNIAAEIVKEAGKTVGVDQLESFLDARVKVDRDKFYGA